MVVGMSLLFRTRLAAIGARSFIGQVETLKKTGSWSN